MLKLYAYKMSHKAYKRVLNERLFSAPNTIIVVLCKTIHTQL